MTQLVFFLEEPSAEEMLKAVLPRILPPTVEIIFVVFDGKQDLEKRLPMRLRAWQRPDAKFLIMRDQDNGDCYSIKQSLVQKCQATGKTNFLVRIACRELESFYLGDLQAVSKAIGPEKIGTYQNKKKYRDPDKLSKPFHELKKIAPSYQKKSGSRSIGGELDLEKNRSRSFNSLIWGIKKIAT